MSNIPELGTTRSRLLAFGLLFLLLGAIVRFGALPLWALYQRNTESLQEQRFQLEQYRSVGRSVSKREMELEQLLADDEIGRYALSEDSPALAAAELQEKVKALIVGGGGKLTSFRVLPTKPEGEFERVSVNVRATLENDALQKVLHSLESVTPFLTVDNLVITSGQRRAARRTRRRNSRPEASQDVVGCHVRSGGASPTRRTGPARADRSARSRLSPTPKYDAEVGIGSGAPGGSSQPQDNFGNDVLLNLVGAPKNRGGAANKVFTHDTLALLGADERFIAPRVSGWPVIRQGVIAENINHELVNCLFELGTLDFKDRCHRTRISPMVGCGGQSA